ncbi:MAG: alpha-ketoglutarate-dependent dioxygenase AlkB [Symploca sp. SIO3C6]|uniref:Alpha-ketoglutarate-dependent dioxygenase AlkB n=1 Tax=Symploca sp. SIO1C4 TaxID=2607765 RepID=A0A6B3N8F6_9CYAN|nr:alpha-ketoglutarate-dependent dioxygenase AlkB [Symploca sp. SIO3C6]NER27917.1 alpha-ketoglutarate-dependent dioxygenase AlkB [Symploca sp. SIO1C4]
MNTTYHQPELDLEVILASDAINIPGLTYIPQYIDIEEQTKLLNIIDQQVWSIKLQRRIQHYGYRYDYKKGSLTSSRYLGSLPDWAQCFARRFLSEHLTTTISDQVIVNEYQPGQGISSHIDCIPCFGNTIAVLSLASVCVMNFTHSQTQEKTALPLLPGSVLVLKGEARYNWQHSIAGRQQDNYRGRQFVRNRRVSLIFREVLFPYK